MDDISSNRMGDQKVSPILKITADRRSDLQIQSKYALLKSIKKIIRLQGTYAFKYLHHGSTVKIYQSGTYNHIISDIRRLRV